MVLTAPMMGWIWQPNSATMAVTSATCSGVRRLDLGRIMAGREPQSCQDRPQASIPNSIGAPKLRGQRRRSREGVLPAREPVAEADLQGVQEHSSRAPALREGAVRGKVAVGPVAHDRKPASRAVDAKLVASPGKRLEPDQGNARRARPGPQERHAALRGKVSRAGDGADPAAKLFHVQRVPPRLGGLSRLPEYKGLVDLPDAPALELGPLLARKRIVRRRQDEPRCRRIQPVDEPEPARAAVRPQI